MNRLIQILITRDDLSRSEALYVVQEAVDRFNAGDDPEDILHEEFGLEPDFIFDFLALVNH
jgi:hypothetical protein